MARQAENSAGVLAAAGVFVGTGLLELVLGLRELPHPLLVAQRPPIGPPGG